MSESAKRNRSPKRTPPLASVPTAKAEFLAATASPVHGLLAASVELKDFRKTAGLLTLPERQLLVEQAIVLLERNYVHLTFKMALHAVNPVRRLRRLRARLRAQTEETMDREEVFHAELSEIFNSLRDLHTTYRLPLPYKERIAFLPFLIEEYWDDATGSHFVVSHLVEGYKENASPGFAVGAEVTHWNGIQIDRAVDLLADRFAGSNPAAQRARAIEALTLRQLVTHLPPDEDWASITYLSNDNASHELREPWFVVENFKPEADLVDGAIPRAGAEVVGLDIGTEELNRARRMLFAPASIERERQTKVLQAREPGVLPAAAAGDNLPTTMDGVFLAGPVDTSSGTFGHLRLFTFGCQNCNPPQFIDDFITEFIRLIEALPQDGLIVDLRGNPGGFVLASERILQTLSPRPIEPELFQFINTEQNLALSRAFKDMFGLEPWISSLEQGLETGEVFSGAYPITHRDVANAIGQKYHGAVVLVTDARCYSAADIFAAGFQDHTVGPILGVDDNTGAGGAQVWTQGTMKSWLIDFASPLPTGFDDPYVNLPKSADFGFAIRRSLRVGPATGMPLEDLGVIPNYVHMLTRNDILNNNADLLDRAGELLAELLENVGKRTLIAAATLSAGNLAVQLETAGIDRIDLYVDGRPRASVDLGSAPETVTVPGVTGATCVRVEGFQANELVANRVINL